MPTTFPFDPESIGSSPGLSSSLERVFGASRWAHNRAMITQWGALRSGHEAPTLEELITGCIDLPSEEAETTWLKLVPRKVMEDELVVLAEDAEYLRRISIFRNLPLKKKKDDQEVIYPPGSYTFSDGLRNEVTSPEFDPINNGLVLWLELTGHFKVDPNLLAKSVNTDGVKIERSSNFRYTATVYFEGDDA